ncbi:MAG: hypothetical protein SO130_09085, partial [Agathobacter sp.]|nr:hypothetical protein [Agathobacter sp.]
RNRPKGIPVPSVYGSSPCGLEQASDWSVHVTYEIVPVCRSDACSAGGQENEYKKSRGDDKLSSCHGFTHDR